MKAKYAYAYDKPRDKDILEGAGASSKFLELIAAPAYQKHFAGEPNEVITPDKTWLDMQS